MAAARKPKPKPADVAPVLVVEQDGLLRALVDLVIERLDVGAGWTTTLQAGDLVPPALASFPRSPA